MTLSFSKRIIDHGWYDGRKIIAHHHHHRLFLEEQVFLFGRCPSEVVFSLFKISTWYHYKFSLSGGGGVFYYLFRASSAAVSFDGTIECEGEDMLALLAGIYFIDAYLEDLGRG